MDELTAGMIAQIHEVEQKDENQVMAELAGETVEEYVYETWIKDPKTKQKVRKVRLSWVGTREVARNRGNIVLDTPEVTETDDSWRVMVRATDLLRNFTVFGGCHQPKEMKVNEVDESNGEIIGSHYEHDDYAFQKGLSKCQRNALNLCIPGEYAARMIDRFLRASGKRPLLALRTKDTAARGHKQPPQSIGPTKLDIKPREEWDKITQEMVPDYPHLETIIWNLCKLQPKGMYAELGGGTRNDMTVPAWHSFLNLKERYSPIQS
ncbi:hypothetical protein ES703_54749 [subsurface metagenome]